MTPYPRKAGAYGANRNPERLGCLGVTELLSANKEEHVLISSWQLAETLDGTRGAPVSIDLRDNFAGRGIVGYVGEPQPG